ncbi:MAG TPA: alpha/beta fold hydrolase [Actinomycetota bacterium]|nr:alpha/beta fold hydrolase [Actinomycetota bacterium]
MTSEPGWTRRFTATAIGFPSWSSAAPDRLALISNRSGSSQVWAHDLADASWRQVSDEPVGVESVHVLPDGRICWWRDATGGERGHALAVPFEGGEPATLVRDLPDGWPMGISFVGDRIALGLEAGGIYGVYVADPGAPARKLYELKGPAGVGRMWPDGGGLSSDGRLVCVRHTEHGDILHEALRVLDADSGETVGDLVDEGRNLDPGTWSPVPGDHRLAVTSELGEFERPAIWDLDTGERRDLAVDLPGGVFPVDWWPDGSALLVRHEHHGRAQLHRLDVAGGALSMVADPGGNIGEAAVRPDGEVWYETSDSVRPNRVLADAGREVLTSPDEPPPAGRAYRSVFTPNPHGEEIQSFLVTPEGAGPFPTVLSVHGGPEWHERDAFDPEVQAFVDEGYAVLLVNYRGSTGYGSRFRLALIGDVCFTETEDLLACLDAQIAAGVVDPERVFWHGWSWGGCLACFNAGMHPDRWRAIFAGIPAGDFVAAHWASAPELQAWDDAVYGGSPTEVPESYARSDPMTTAANVTAPVLIIAGRNDPRCPPEGVDPWVDAVRAAGAIVEVDYYPEGHHTNAVAAQVDHQRRILEFFARYR